MTSTRRVAARYQLPRTDTGRTRPVRPETEAGTTEGIWRTTLGRVRPSSSWLPELLRWGRHKTQAQPCLCFCGVPENLNLSGLGLGSARNSGPVPWRAAWSLSAVDRESTQPRAGADTVWPEHCECSPHRPAICVCSAPPSPHTTEQANLNERPPSPAPVRAEIRHRGQRNKGNRFRSDRCNRLKSL